MDTIRKIRKLKHKRSKTNEELLQLAHDLGLTINNQDKRLLQLAETNHNEQAACEDARERLLLKLDTYQSGQQSKLSRTLALISVVLSIVAAVLSIYASLVKK